MRKKWLRWAWILPVGEVMLAFVVAGIPALHVLRKGWAHPIQSSRAVDGRLTMLIPPELARIWLADETRKRFPDRFEAISYLNLPAVLVEILISLPTTWPDSWSPHWAWALGLDGFRAVSWPLWALPFWFFSGRGMDSFFRDEVRISAFEAFSMGLFSAAIAVATIGIATCAPFRKDEAYMRWMIVPCAMWVGFGVICQLAWWRHWRAHRVATEIPAKTERTPPALPPERSQTQ
jgi:hypothetical protein